MERGEANNFLLRAPLLPVSREAKRIKLFCFFFSKKKRFLPAFPQLNHPAYPLSRATALHTDSRLPTHRRPVEPALRVEEGLEDRPYAADRRCHEPRPRPNSRFRQRLTRWRNPSTLPPC